MHRLSLYAFRATLPIAVASWLLTACAAPRVVPPTAQAAPALQGSVLLGPQPVAGARIYLLPASPGLPSASLLTSGDGKDALGSYLLSDHAGHFTVPPENYTCLPGQPILLYALGGDPAGPAGLLALTHCAAPTPPLALHEPAGIVAGSSGTLWLTGLGSTPLLELEPPNTLKP